MPDTQDKATINTAETEPIITHFNELRQRLLYSFAILLIVFFVCFYCADYIFNFLTKPLMDAFGDSENRRLIYTGLAEKFFTNIKLAFFSALIITMPFILCQIWKFIAPGLYQHERKIFLPFVLMTPVLFALGVMFVYYFVLPVAWDFFIGFEQQGSASNLPVQLESKVDEYLSLVMQLIFAFGLVFELPIVLLLLVMSGIVSIEALKDKRRYAILGAFVVAAVLTPPDPLSQIGLAIPMILLYELSIIIGTILEKKKNNR